MSNADGTSLDTAVFNFDSSTRTLKVFTSSPDKAGLIGLKIIG